jgi:hypothetical protein
MACGLLNTRAPLFRQLQQPGAGHVFHVERRVLAHQHGVESGQRQHGGLAQAEPVVGIVKQFERPRHGLDHVASQRKLRLQAEEQLMPVRGRLGHHGVGGILVRLEGFQRVGDEKNAHDGSSRWRQVEGSGSAAPDRGRA